MKHDLSAFLSCVISALLSLIVSTLLSLFIRRAPTPIIRCVPTISRSVRQALDRSQTDLPSVAVELRVSSTTLWRKMKRLGISGEQGPAG